jgi:Pyridoxamine 5'-phosphate oxidase
MARDDRAGLPAWEPGTVGILSTAGPEPHAIPVSTCVRSGPRTVHLALALGRESLARLRRDPRCALTLLAGGNVSLTAHGRATIVEDPMRASDRVAAVRLDIELIHDHSDPRHEILAGVSWRWTDREAEAADARIRAALAQMH